VAKKSKKAISSQSVIGAEAKRQDPENQANRKALPADHRKGFSLDNRSLRLAVFQNVEAVA
jgi:hypothetical protein